jgi:hypothetical protein
MKLTPFRMTETQYRAARKKAAELGRTFSGYMRWLISRDLEAAKQKKLEAGK